MSSKHCEAVKSIYRRNVANGLCGKCGRPLDRDGSICVSCNERHKKFCRESRKWYLEHGICPTCGKNNLAGSERNCPECRSKKAAYAAAERGEIGSPERAESNRKHRENQKKRYYELIENGICTNCKKRYAEDGFRMCPECRAKIREYKRIRSGFYAKPAKRDRYMYGLCTFCNEPLKPGYKVCEKHYELYSKIGTCENAVKARERMKKQGVFNIYLGRNRNGRNSERMS